MDPTAATPSPTAPAPAPAAPAAAAPAPTGDPLPVGDDPTGGAPDGTPSEAAPADGAPPAATGPAPRFFKDEYRDDIRERLRQRRAAERQDPSVADLRTSIAATAGDGATDTTDADATQAGPTTPGEQATPSPGSPAAPAPAPTPAPETGFTVVTVNGMSFEVPTAEVNARGGIRAYQMEKAAEITLANAKRIENEARDLRRQASAPAPAAPTAAAPAPGGRPAPVPAAVDDLDVAQELLDGVLESDPARIRQALGKIRGQAPAPQPAAPAPTSAPAPAPAPANDFGRPNQDLAAGNQVFDNEFGFLRERPGAFERARADIVSALQDPANASVPAYLLVRKIGSDITRLTGGRPPAGAPSPAAREALDQRRTAKARLPLSSAAGGRVPVAAPAPAATPRQKTSSYIANLRARSGSNASIAERRTSR